MIMKILSAKIPQGMTNSSLAAGVSAISVRSSAANFTAPSLVPAAAKEQTAKLYDKFIESLASGIGKLAQMEPVKKTVEFCVNKEVNYTSHLAALVANILNGFYMYNVHKSEKIEPEQKKPLMLNMFIGTALATAGGYLLDNAIKGKLKPFEDAMRKYYKGADALTKGFEIARSLMVFQFLYRFVTPVVATPIANYISNKVRDKKDGDKGLLLK